MGTPSQTVPELPRYIIERDTRLLAGDAQAVFSEDRAYRFRLSRTWGPGDSRAVWIMLNPSTADAFTDDPTIRRCVRLTRSWGLDGLVVVNLFAARATDPSELPDIYAPLGLVGPGNDETILAACTLPGVTAVAAWGVHGALYDRDAEVSELLDEAGVRLRCVGRNKAGSPKHPLYVRANAPLIPYEVPDHA
jgi:hypothetical protein